MTIAFAIVTIFLAIKAGLIEAAAALIFVTVWHTLDIILSWYVNQGKSDETDDK